MLPKSIIDMILAKYGKKQVFAADCLPLARSIGLGETTVKRMLGLVGVESVERNRTPHKSTMDILAKWLGYGNYKELLREIGESGSSSEFTVMESIDVTTLEEGAGILLRYEPSREIVMTYLENNRFIVRESKNSKLCKGDQLMLTTLVKGQELLVTDVIRDGKSLGGFRGAKDGGLVSLEIMD